MNNHFNRPPPFFRPPPFNNRFGGHMQWGSPRHPSVRQFRPPFIKPPPGMSPEGVLMPSHMQAPPMFGPRGATIPPHLMNTNYHQHGKGFKNNNHHVGTNDTDLTKQFWCEPCDRGFNTNDILEKHKLEHQKCGIDGCTFTAHAKMVTNHIQMQHKTGLYDKIRNINTPEDIANWIKERKKNFPTKENIEKKKAQQKECFDRGEKLQDNNNRFNNNKGNNRRDKRFDNRKNKFRNGDNKHKTNWNNSQNQPFNSTVNNKNSSTELSKDSSITPIKKDLYISRVRKENVVEEVDNYHNLKPFRGTSDIVRNDLICDDIVLPVANDLDIEDEEWQELERGKEKSPPQTPAVCSALSNLISAYDSSDEEPEEISSKMFKKNIHNLVQTGKESHKNDNNLSNQILAPMRDTTKQQSSNNKDQDETFDGSEPDEVKIIKHVNDSTVPEESLSDTSHKRTRKRKHSANQCNKEPIIKKNNNQKHTKDNDNINQQNSNNKRIQPKPQSFKKRLPKTLLEKLLEKDIRHERNIILQCVHYIVENNFFQSVE